MKREIKKETEEIWRREYNKVIGISRDLKEKSRVKNQLNRKKSLKTSMTKLREKLKREVMEMKMKGNYYMVINSMYRCTIILIILIISYIIESSKSKIQIVLLLFFIVIRFLWTQLKT